jgi:hypothetical protein
LIECDKPRGTPGKPGPWSCLCVDPTGKQYSHRANACTECCPKTTMKGCSKAIN